MKKTLRLLLFEDCNRSCEGCCNRQWNLGNLPVVKDFTPYDEIILTGGEPMMRPDAIWSTIISIREQNMDASIILYTAMIAKPYILHDLMKYLDGLTVTLHDQQDVIPFVCFAGMLDKSDFSKSLRMNVFEGVDLSDHKISFAWQLRDHIKMLENCPLPDNEVFMRL